MMFVVCFNGPPECGKDTLAQMLAEHIKPRSYTEIRQDSLALMLRRLAYTLTSYEGKSLEGDDYAAFKKTAFRLGDKLVTGRQIMIDASERFLKPTYGKEIMASLLLNRYLTFDGLLLIRDSGFQLEVDPIVRFAGMDNVYIVNVEREGKSFAFDSREWVRHPNSKCQMRVQNNGTLEDLRTEAGRIYGRLVNQMGWKL